MRFLTFRYDVASFRSHRSLDTDDPVIYKLVSLLSLFRPTIILTIVLLSYLHPHITYCWVIDVICDCMFRNATVIHRTNTCNGELYFHLRKLWFVLRVLDRKKMNGSIF